jgi:hypothetical protein
MSEPTPRGPSAAPPAEPETAVERLFFHEDRTLNQRTDWLLVFHSIMFEAFFQAASYGRLASVATSGFGLLSALAWARVAARNREGLGLLRAEFAKTSPFFLEGRGAPGERAGLLAKSGLASPWLTLALPLAAIVVWAILFASAVQHSFFS